MRIFKAVLTKAISYTDFNGNVRTLSAGNSICVSRLHSQFVSHDLNGNSTVEPVNSFIGSFGNDSFDIEPFEFATLQ